MAAHSKVSFGNRAKHLPAGLWIFFGFLILVFVGVGSAFGILLGYEYNLPPIQNLEDYQPDVITDVYSNDNQVIGELFLQRRIIVSYDEIPTYMRLALLAAEDRQFYEHSGINYFSIIRAIFKDVIRLRFPPGRGASTITQQLARMLIDRYEVTLDRKIKEVLIAWKIEKLYSKQQILTLYCNLHGMGHGIYGVAAAADSYFGKQLNDLSLEECALIAGLPRSPARYSPRTHPEAALARRNLVIDGMAAEHMISRKLADEAKKRPVVLKYRARGDTGFAPHFLEWVRRYLANRYSTDEIWRKGLQVYTTLDVQMQKAAHNALNNGLRNYDKNRGWRGPIENILAKSSDSLAEYAHPSWRYAFRPGDIVVGLVEGIGEKEAAIRVGKYRGTIGPKGIAWTRTGSPEEILKPGDLAYFKIVSLDDVKETLTVTLEQRPEVEGAVIILDNRTGETKAMVGGYDFEESEFNRATQAMRQVGSTFKPFVYATAFEKGMVPDSTVLDAPISFTDGLGRSWKPSNYDGQFEGQISLRQALIESRNIPAIRVASLVGIKNVVHMARRFGLNGRLDPYLPLALGACEATPMEMASAFTVFPNLGIRAEPYFVREVEDYDREVKEKRIPQIHSVLKPEIAAVMLDLLQNVVQNENGTAHRAKSIGRPLGGKTGTTDNFTDAWFIGFTPSITAAVWVGYDDNRTLGNRQSGSVVALPIWIECMQEILRDQPIEQFASAELTDPISYESSGSDPLNRKPLFVEDLPSPPPATTNEDNQEQ
jgi:penicillin-binding protein 1A